MKLGLRVAAATLLAISFGPSVSNVDAACIAGGVVSNINDCLQASKGSKDCLMAWAVDFDGAGSPPPNEKKVVCEDGAACDRDGHVNGSCTFHVGACVNTGVAGCTTATLTNLTFKKPSLKSATTKAAKTPDAYFARRDLLNDVAGLLPAVGESCSADDIEIRVPLKRKGGTCNSPAATKCTNDQDCDDYCVPIYKKGKSSIKATADDGGSLKDSDSLKFFCLPAPAPTTDTCAEAFQVTNAADLIGGPVAQGRVGDWMLQNGQVRVLVRDVGRAHSFMLTYGGHIIDADLRRANPADERDNFMGLQTMVHLSATQNTQSISVLNDGADCSPAILRTSGPDDLLDVLSPELAIFQAGNTLSIPLDTVDNNLPLTLTTDYIISPQTNYVEIATTFANSGATDLHLLVGDYVNGAGTVEMFGPGVGFGEPLLRLGAPGVSAAPQGLDFLSWNGVREAKGVAYGLVLPRHIGADDKGKPVDGTFLTGAFIQSGVGTWVDGQQLLGVLNAPATSKPVPPFLVPAGGENILRRWFVVGEGVNDVTRAREDLFGHKVGLVQGIVTSGGQPVDGGRVAFIRGGRGNRCISGSPCANIFSATTTDADGFYRAYLPADLYEVHFRAPGTPFEGSASASPKHTINLKARKTELIDIDLPDTGAIRVVIADQNGSPIAGKVSVVGFEASPDPMSVDSIVGFIDSVGRYFGYEVEEKDNDVFGIRTDLFADQTGDTGTHKLEPGTYHIVVSHGPEYDVFDQAITVTAGVTETINATVNQVVDTTGFVSIDTHVHMIQSPDSNISVRRRIISMLAEGVDFFAPTDHDSVHDITADIAALGATGLVAVAPSNELTTFVYGHYNMWPLTVDPASIIGGAYDWGDSTSLPGLGYPSDGSYDVLPATFMGDFNPANQVIQINHINSSTLGFFNNLGLDTEAIPPVTSSQVYRCVGGPRGGLPCDAELCVGGGADGIDCRPGGAAATCTSGGGTCNTQPVGRDCPAGSCDDSAANLSSFLRMDPAVANLYSDNYTALEVWIESSRAQTDLALNDNFGDWAGLLNQGLFKTGVADSDTHQRTEVPAGAPRTFVASPTDDPAAISASTLALNVNAGRALGSNSLFMRVSLEGDAGATASHDLADPMTVAATAGSAIANIHIESPTWAEFDTVEIYTNSVPACESGFNFMGVVDRECDISPSITLNAGSGFTVTTATGVSGFGSRLVADIAQPLTVTADTWVIVVARGTDDVSRPLFPVIPVDLLNKACVGGFNPGAACESNGDCIFGTCTSANPTLADLTDSGVSPPWNLGENGVLATAFSNPLFLDFEGDGLCHGGTACP